MTNKEKQEKIKNLKLKIKDKIQEDENIQEQFINECLDAQFSACDIDVEIIATINKKTFEILNIEVETSYPSYWNFPNEEIKEIAIYSYHHKVLYDDMLWDFCVDTWKEENITLEDDDDDYSNYDYNEEEVKEHYNFVFKDEFCIECYEVYDLEEILFHTL